MDRLNSIRRVMVTICCLYVGSTHAALVKTGLDQVEAHRSWFEGRRVGLIANQTAVNAEGKSIVEVFQGMTGTKVTALFAPEHGLWGSRPAGQDVETTVDPNYGIPVFSLYRQDGRMAKPTPDMLQTVDVLVFDIQDIGTRFYTYIWTLALAQEAAAENQVPFVVMDRPNPIASLGVQGPVLDRDWASFKGLYPIPVMHGMTVGELAGLFNGEHWLAGGIRANLKVIPMQGWSRRMRYDRTGLTFVPPSPNMRTLETALLYPGMALFEGTNVSEGRGTNRPFLQFGAPWLRAGDLMLRLNALNLKGVQLEPTDFTPSDSKYQGQLCHGLRLHISDPNQLRPFYLGVQIVRQVYNLHEQVFNWRRQHFDELCGTDTIRRAITAHESIDDLVTQWQAPLKAFQALRQTYLLYGLDDTN